jgi:hypothetical protein
MFGVSRRLAADIICTVTRKAKPQAAPEVADLASLGCFFAPIVAPDAGDKPRPTTERAPQGRPLTAVRLLLRAAPWMCEREVPGTVPVAQLLGVTASGLEVYERHTRRAGWRGEGPEWQGVPWNEADRQECARRTALRIGKRVRRLALRRGVPISKAALHLAEREVADARSWSCAMGRWVRIEVEGQESAGDPTAIEFAWSQRTAKIAKAFAAAAEMPAVRNAVPFPDHWRKNASISPKTAGLLKAERDELAAVVRDALAKGRKAKIEVAQGLRRKVG